MFSINLETTFVCTAIGCCCRCCCCCMGIRKIPL